MKIFVDDDHKNFFGDLQHRSGNTDSYHRALFYTIGISQETRDHYLRIYNLKDREIRPECLEEGWQTGTSRRICLLAFNLFNGYIDKQNPNLSTPENLFACEFAPFFARAIAMRYPEYRWETGRKY